MKKYYYSYSLIKSHAPAPVTSSPALGKLLCVSGGSGRDFPLKEWIFFHFRGHFLNPADLKSRSSQCANACLSPRSGSLSFISSWCPNFNMNSPDFFIFELVSDSKATLRPLAIRNELLYRGIWIRFVAVSLYYHTTSTFGKGLGAREVCSSHDFQWFGRVSLICIVVTAKYVHHCPFYFSANFLTTFLITQILCLLLLYYREKIKKIILIFWYRLNLWIIPRINHKCSIFVSIVKFLNDTNLKAIKIPLYVIYQILYILKQINSFRKKKK